MRRVATVERWQDGVWHSHEPENAPADMAVPLTDGHHIDVTGGCWFAADDDGITGHVRRLDLDAACWREAPPLTTARYCHAAVRREGREAYVVGGLAAGDPTEDNLSGLFATASVEKRGDDETWVAVAPLPIPAAEPEVVLLADGRLFACGGYDDEGTDFAATYDPERDRWTAVAPLPGVRMAHAALRLDDGRVLVVGGASSFDPEELHQEILLFDPATERWRAFAWPHVFRAGHRLTLLEDGAVLVTGRRADGEAAGVLFTP